MTPTALSDRIRLARERRAQADERATVLIDPDAPLILSSAQRRLWFLHQLDPASAAYNIPIVHDLIGDLDVDRLRQAWDAVVMRHSVLRTRYPELDGEVVLTVDDAPTGSWRESVGDWRHLTDQTIAEPFDLDAEQPWRVVLLPGVDQWRHRLIIVLHHIAADGWSVGILMRDLATAYNTGAGLPAGASYSDFARYRATPLGSEGGTTQYWHDHLQGAPALLDLPTDRPRPPLADEAGATMRVALPAAAAGAVRSLRATGATPFMTLLAAWHVVLGRWAGVDDVVIGTPVAGRNRPEWEDVVGCCVNTLALRTRTDAGATVQSLVTQCRDVTVDGLANQAIGFEDVVESLGLDRDVSSTPLYQVSLTVHSEPGAELGIEGLDVTWVDAMPSVAKVDLGIHVDGGLVAHDSDLADLDCTVSISYRTALFDEDTVRRMVDHLDLVLQQLAADSTATVESLSLLTPQDLAALPLGRDLSTPQPIIAGASTLPAMVAAVAAQHPDRIAVTSRGEDLRYRELIDAAAVLAGDLTAAGVVRGDRVVLLADRCVDVVVAMIAITSLGAAYVPIDPMYPNARIQALIAGADARVILAQPHLRHRVDHAGIAVVDLRGSTHNDDQLPLPDDAMPDDVAYVLFTSGTTGAPKGVQVEHRHLLGYLAALDTKVQVQPGWSWAMMTTPSADLGLTNLFGALATGGRVHLLTYQQVTDPEQVAGYFRRHRIDAMKLVPSHLQSLWDEADPTALLPERLLILAGEPCPWELVDRISAAAPDLPVHNHYGPTETTVSTMGQQVAGPKAAGHRRGSIAPIGAPFAGTRAHVLDAAGRPVPDGVPGELVLAGHTIARGYLGLEEATAQKFITEPEGTGRAYRTGDRVRRRDGEIEFLGRVDDQIKIRGYRVEPGDVAAVLRQHPLVSDIAVIARQDRPGVRTLAAYVVATAHEAAAAEAAGSGDLADQLRTFAKAELPDHMVPADIVELAALPLSANGKVDRGALPAPDPARRTRSDRPPSGPTEERIAAIWCDVLGLEVGATTEFFDAGGDSFSAVRLARAIGVSVVDVFSHPTVAALAELIDGPGTAAGSGLLRRLDNGSATPSVHIVCVPYGGGSAVTFAPLAAAVDGDIAVYGVDLPGHDISRRDESPQPLPAVADALVAEIAALDGEVVMYGHCLGGALAVETGLRLEQAGVTVTGVITGGTFPAARLPGRLARLWDRIVPSDRWLSNRAYHEMLRSLGGFTEVIDPADRDFLITALRHDARTAEGYYTKRYTAVEAGQATPKLRAPMLCIVGDRDRATEMYQERFAEWEEFSDAVDLAVIKEAGHYFLKHQAEELSRIIVGQVALWRAGRRPNAIPSAAAAAGQPNTRTFLMVAITQLLSMIGTGLTSFGVGVWVFQQTSSVSAFSLILILAMLPAIGLMPFAGVVADRFDRRKVMLIADGVAGLSTAAMLALVLTDTLAVGHIYAFAAIGAAANAFQRPAYLAAVTQLVPKRYLGQAGGLVSLGTNAGDLLAALLGGIVVSQFGLRGVIAIDLVTFTVAFGILLRVRFPNRMWLRLEESFRAELVGGWRYIVRRRPLVVMVVFFCVFNFVFALPNLLVTPLVLSLHSETTLGFVLAGGGVGALVGAALMAIWGGTRRRAVGMVGGTVTLGLGVIVLGASQWPLLMAVGLMLMFGSLLVLNAHWMALIQSKVGLELQGRVLAVNQMLAMASMPVGFLLTGPLTQKLQLHLGTDAALHPISVAVLICGAVLCLWGVLGLGFRPLRRMEDDLPDAVPDAVIVADRDQLQAQADAAYQRLRQGSRQPTPTVER